VVVSAQPSLLVGRDGDAAALDTLLEDGRAGRGRALMLWGEPGIGKTALLERAVVGAVGMQVLRVAGLESEAKLSFAALRQFLEPLLTEIADVSLDQRDALERSLGLPGGDSADPYLVDLGVLALLVAAAEKQPVLCVVDDAQWLGQGSGEALAFAAHRLEGLRIVMLFVVEEPLDDGEVFEGLGSRQVVGLSDDDAGKLLDTAVWLEAGVRARLVAGMAGNPLALLSVAKELSSDQLQGAAPLPDPLPLGERLEGSLLRRVRSLPVDTQALLLLVAAEPGGDAELLWRAADGLELGSEALRPVEGQGLLDIGPEIGFRHPFLQRVLLAAATVDERRQVHLALAEAADPDSEPDRRAWHRAASASGPDETLASDLEQSAPAARQRGGYAAAAALLRRAAEVTPDGKARAQRLLGAAEAELAAGAAPGAEALLAELDLERPDKQERARAERLRARLEFAVGSGRDSSAALLETARSLAPRNVRLARDTYLDALEFALWAGRLGTNGSALETARAASAAPPLLPGSKATAPDLLLDGFAAVLTEGHTAGAPLLRRAIEAVLKERQMRWTGLAFVAAFEVWDDEALHRVAARRIELARRAGALTVLPHALTQLGVYEVVVGRLGAAEALIVEAREIATAARMSGVIGSAELGMLLVSAWRGEATTRPLAAATTRDANARGLGAFVSCAQLALAILELGLGHYEAALSAAHAASLDPAIATRTLPELVEAAARSGDSEVTAAAVKRLAETVLPSGTEWGLGVLATSRALASENGDAETLYLEGIDRLGRCRARPQLARAKLVYGEWLRRQRRRRDAREQLRAAYEMLASMGLGGFAERARIELLATGERARHRPAQSDEPLTPHELRIADLVAEGASNVEIAEQLFISPKTVEYHLHKIFRKLGISSRTQVARALELRRDRRSSQD
jgi:DNA-binding CsgD family transcriptional regulator